MENKIYSQEQLKNFFYHVMDESEMEKMNELNVKDILSIITTPTYQIKYIKDIGYVFLGEGYLIFDNGTEPTHYFLHHIFEKVDDAKLEIIKEYQGINK